MISPATGALSVGEMKIIVRIGTSGERIHIEKIVRNHYDNVC